MKYPTDNLNNLVDLFNCNSKRELEKLAKDIIIHQQDFVEIILAAQHNELSPYNYANYFDRRIPDHLMPTEEEHEAISKNGVGKYKTRKAQKFANKIFQLPIQQRITAAHLFYTSDQKYWDLFYFDDKDRSKYDNHWKYGPHIHFVSDLWPN
ncbi:MAG: hypothetical protein PHU29_10050, partial [Sulfuricurvum sp.]|nr:hypothetical protein [Sulfuricurvum sp.]